jgi:hypothetical protein
VGGGGGQIILISINRTHTFSLLVQAIKNAPGCIHPLVSRVLPYTVPILNKVGADFPIFVKLFSERREGKTVLIFVWIFVIHCLSVF